MNSTETLSTQPMSANQIEVLEVLRRCIDSQHRWPEGMKTATACEYLDGISDKCLQNIAKAHNIHRTQPGGLWPKAELDRYLASQIERETV